MSNQSHLSQLFLHKMFKNIFSLSLSLSLSLLSDPTDNFWPELPLAITRRNHVMGPPHSLHVYKNFLLPKGDWNEEEENVL